MKNTFDKQQRLCGQLRVKTLFANGKRLTAWPLRVTYLPLAGGETQVLVRAPKALFKRAVHRNRLKRLMREAWRLHQHELVVPMQVAFNYMDRTMQSYQVVERAMVKSIRKLNENNDRQSVDS